MGKFGWACLCCASKSNAAQNKNARTSKDQRSSSSSQPWPTPQQTKRPLLQDSRTPACSPASARVKQLDEPRSTSLDSVTEVDSPAIAAEPLAAQDATQSTSTPRLRPSAAFTFETPAPTKPAAQPNSPGMPKELHAVLTTQGTRKRHEVRLATHAAIQPELCASGELTAHAVAAAATLPAGSPQPGLASVHSVADLVAQFRDCLELLRNHGMTRVRARGSGAALHKQLRLVSAAMKSLRPDAELLELHCVGLAIQDLDALIRRVAEERLARSDSFCSTGSERTLVDTSSPAPSTDSSRVPSGEDAAACARTFSFVSPAKPAARLQSAQLVLHPAGHPAGRELADSGHDMTTWAAAKPSLQAPPALAVEASVSLDSAASSATLATGRYVSKKDAKRERKARAKAAAQALAGNAVDSLVDLYSPRAGNVRRSKLVVL